MVTVKILSNWGDPKEVRCSSILILDESRMPINVLQISSVPIQPILILNKLIDRVLVKTNSENIWSSTWPCQEYDDISLIFWIPFSTRPKFLRIWNPNDFSKTSVKEISVLIGSKVCFTGEIPEGFGIDVLLSQNIEIQAQSSIAILSELFPQFAPEKGYFDKYGSYPLLKSKYITIEILSNWGDENYYGLNGIKIYNEDFKLINLDRIKEIVFDNTLSYSDPKLLIKDNFDSLDFSDMFIGEGRWSSGHPKIIIKFTQTTRISQISFLNFNAMNRSLKIGLKDIKIYFSTKLIWAGRINIGQTKSYSLSNLDYKIWLIDDPEFKIKENLNY